MEEPAQLVTFLWPGAGGRTGVVHLSWRRNWSLKRYLHEHPLRQFHLCGFLKHGRAIDQNQKRVRLHHVLQPGTTVVLTRVAVRAA